MEENLHKFQDYVLDLNTLPSGLLETTAQKQTTALRKLERLCKYLTNTEV